MLANIARIKKTPGLATVNMYLLGQGSGGLGLGDGGIRKSKNGGGFGHLGHDNGFNHRAEKSAAVWGCFGLLCLAFEGAQASVGVAFGWDALWCFCQDSRNGPQGPEGEDTWCAHVEFLDWLGRVDLIWKEVWLAVEWRWDDGRRWELKWLYAQNGRTKEVFGQQKKGFLEYDIKKEESTCRRKTSDAERKGQ